MRTAQIDLLDHLTKSTGVEYDPALARQVIHQVEREVPGPAAATWGTRLELVGREFGLRVRGVHASTRQVLELIRPWAPVATFLPEPEPDPEPTQAPPHANGDGASRSNGTGNGVDFGAVRYGSRSTPEEPGTWFLAVDRKGRKVRLVGLGPGQKDQWIRDTELARRLGAAGVHDPLDWVLVQSATPCEGMRRDEGADEGHDAGHGGGHHGQGGGHDLLHGHWAGHEHPSPFRRLMGMLKPEGRDLLILLTFALVAGVLYLGTPLAVETLVQFVAFGGLVQPVVVLSFILFGVLGLASAILALQTYVVELMQRRIFVKLTADLSYRLPRTQMETLDRRNAVELVNRFFDVVTVQKAMSGLLGDGLGLVISTLVGMMVLAFYHPFLLGYDIVLAGLILFGLFTLGRGAISTSIRESRAKYAVAGWLEELARDPLSFRQAGGPDFAVERADGLARVYLEARSDHFRILMRQIIFALVLQAVAGTALLALGGWLVVTGQMTLGQLVAAELIVSVIVGGVAKVGKHLETYYDLMAAMDKIGHLIDLPLERRGGEALPWVNTGASVRLTGVSYQYPEMHHETLSHLSLDVSPGEYVAIVGAGGAGKSTLVDLFYGIRSPTGGAIEIDGADLRDLRLDSVREHVSVVKAFEVVEGTILENVRIGRAHFSITQVREALAAVGLLADVRALPDGIHTRLSPNGQPLSRGQARRLMIARALLGRPRLLIVDELLDALDVDVRMAVCDALFDRTAARSMIVITHHQEVARRCDRVYRLHHGRLEELPTPALEDTLGWKVG